MARAGVVGRWISPLLLVGAVLLWPVVGVGDWDPPGPPPIGISVEVLSVELLQDQDDGLDGNAELILVVSARSRAGSAIIAASKDDLNWDETHVWTVAESAVLGQECTPASDIVFVGTLAELDNGVKEQVLNILRVAVRTAFMTWWSGWAGAAGSLAAGLVSSTVLYLNGNDDLGTGSTVLTGGSWGTISLNGADGSAQIRVTSRVDQLPDRGQCGAPQKQVPEGKEEQTKYDKNRIIAKVFEPLKESYWTIFYEVEYEKGNPAGLSRSQILALQKSLLSYYLRWPESIAALLIADAYRRGADVSGAVREYLRGVQYADTAVRTNDQERRDVNTERALEAFERAALKAAGAGYSSAGVGVGMLSTSADRLPFHIVTVPDYFSTDVGRNPEFPVFVFGADDPVTLSVSGIPDGVQVTTKRLAPELPLFGMKLDLSGARPGKYVLRLKALSGGKDTTADFTLVVN